MRWKTTPACIPFRIPPSSSGGQFHGTSGVTFIRARRGQFTQEFPQDKAQDIVASKILLKAGVAYRVGKTNQFDRKKLDAFKTANPEALANVPRRQKKKK